MSYNAPIGSDQDPRCPWIGNIGVSNALLRSKCVYCEEIHGDEDCEVIHGLVFCRECLEAIEKHGDGIEEEIHFLNNSRSVSTARTA